MTTRAKTLSFRAKTSSFQAKKLKACRGWELLEDRISKLPDELIVYILSLLTMKEAGRTNVLSKRWRYVWADIPVLNFDASSTLDKLLMDEELLEVEKPRYLSWVNQVVGSYKGPTIDEFRVRFDLSVTSRYSIDNWVKFAMEKRVKRLELDFRSYEEDIQKRCYTFHSLSICNSLTSLQLVSVNVTDEVLHNFLKSCPSLEYLSVVGSKSLRNLEITGDALNLKYLEICYSHEIKHVEICAPNLVSFKYVGPKISVPFKRTPKLAKLSIGGGYGLYVTNNFLEFSSHLIQLEALTLNVSRRIQHIMKSADQFPHCKRLKQLEVQVLPGEDEDLFCLAPLINACPFLHKFILKLCWGKPVLKRELLKIEDCPHYHLKIVEIIGFVGHVVDLEFIMYLMKNSIALEKIVLNPCRPTDIGAPWEFEVDTRKIIARKQAEQLRENLQHGAELIIL